MKANKPKVVHYVFKPKQSQQTTTHKLTKKLSQCSFMNNNRMGKQSSGRSKPKKSTAHEEEHKQSTTGHSNYDYCFNAPPQPSCNYLQEKPQESLYVPVGKINSEISDCSIKVRVTCLSPIFAINNDKGFMFTADVIDKFEDEITLVCFGGSCLERHRELCPKRVYSMDKIAVVHARHRFSSVSKQYHLKITSATVIRETRPEEEEEEEKIIPLYKFNGLSVSVLKHLPPLTRVDFFGLIWRVGNVIALANGIIKRTIKMCDRDGNDIELVLWGSQATNMYCRGMTLHVKGCQITQHAGLNYLNGCDYTVVGPKYTANKEWVEILSDKLDWSGLCPFLSIKELCNKNITGNATVATNGYITEVTRSEVKPWYYGAADSYEKVHQTLDGHWRGSITGKKYFWYTLRFSFGIRIKEQENDDSQISTNFNNCQ